MRGPRYPAGQRPDPRVLRALAIAPRGSACDVGAGLGRHAFLLALNGYRVTALDDNPAKVRRLAILAKKKGLPIHAKCVDVRTHPGRARYGLVVATNVLHLLPRDDANSLVERLRRQTRPGGIHVASVMLDDPEHPPPRGKTFFPKRALRALYEGWEILFYREWVLAPIAYARAEAPRKFAYAAVIARRPRPPR